MDTRILVMKKEMVKPNMKFTKPESDLAPLAVGGLLWKRLGSRVAKVAQIPL